MMDSPDLSPGSSPWDTNRTNRTRSSGGKYESAHFFTSALKSTQDNQELRFKSVRNSSKL